MKSFGFLKKGRKIIFSLALFILVFAVASVVKIHAGTEHNIIGWFGGWSEDGSGNFTGAGWVSMNSTNCDVNKNGFVDTGNCGGSDNALSPVFSYGVNIPSGDGPIVGINNYAWSPNIGWVSFNLGELGSCPSAPCNARRSGDKLEGWARVMGIKSEFEKTISNSGDWQGWIKLSSKPGDPFSYGVKINGDGTFADCNPSSGGVGCAWSGENKIAGIPQGLGWVDFEKAKFTTPPPPPACVTGRTICQGGALSCNKDTDCLNSTSCEVTDATHWTCSNGTEVSGSCPAIVNMPDIGECGILNGGSVCNLGQVTDLMLCKKGTAVPGSSNIDTSGYEVTWTCGGQNACPGGSIVSCSAKGKKSCGWIETNP